MNDSLLNRRNFLLHTGGALAAASILPQMAGAQAASGGAPRKIRVASIGVGGRGRNAVEACSQEEIVAFCDVDDARAAETYEKYPQVPRYKDYRVMLKELGDKIEAVTISTPDHSHFPAAMLAISMGKHVYVEKPLTHTIEEARMLRQAAEKKKVITQMGNQGHAHEGPRLLKEWVQAGILGEVKEVHSWTNRPIWPQGMGKRPDHSQFIPVVPKTLDWDLWLGPAEERPYDPAYAPFSWRGWWDYGTGALGDMACHIMDGAFFALDLGYPTAVEAISSPSTKETPPKASVITYTFPARGSMPPLKYTWYDGEIMPRLPVDVLETTKVENNGTLLIGSKATVLCDTYYGSVRIVPEAKMKEMGPKLPPKTLPRVKGDSFKEWFDGIREGKQPGSNFSYSGPLTEVVLLGNLAIRTGYALQWDGPNMKVTNVEAPNKLVRKSYRKGFEFKV